MYKTFIIFILIIGFTSCKKLVDVSPPPTGVTGIDVFESDATAISAATSIYASIVSTDLDGNGTAQAGAGVLSLSFYLGLSADEYTLVDGDANLTYVKYYQDNLSTAEQLSINFWNVFYPVIFSTNSAISGLTGSSGLTPAVKKQLLGEADFMKAFSYFYLINLYGDVPLINSTDYNTNSVIARSPKSLVWAQVKSDLTNARSLLSKSYLDGTLLNTSPERVRPSYWAATALLARTYLYLNKYDSASMLSSEIINEPQFSLMPVSDAFLKNNSETIWELQPVVGGWNTQEARTFILPPTGPNSQSIFPIFLDSSIMQEFEANDARMTNWIGGVNVSGVNYYFPYKYKSATLNADMTEYSIVMRLAEQLLIRAEAKLQLGDVNGALTDLNRIRNRAGLDGYMGGTDKASILNEIIHERRVELFSEWGHRWLDLKRLSAVDSVMSNVAVRKSSTWTATDQYYPIPLSELKLDPKLVQNSGY